MAIKNTDYVKFVYAAAAASASTAAGTISFAADTRQIFVGDGTNAVPFAGNVKDATMVENVLTITRNNGDNVVLDFTDVASTKGVMAVFKQLDSAINGVSAALTEATTALNNEITAITQDGGTIDTKVAAETKAREDADKAINDKIGTVAEGKTLVGMIEAASAAHSVVAKDSSFLTLTPTTGENGAVTYTLGTDDIQSAAAFTTKMTEVDGSIGDIKADIATLNGTGADSVGGKISAAIAGLDSSANGADDAGHVGVTVTLTDGKVTAVDVTSNDIASAKGLGDVSARVKTNEDAIATLNGDGAGSVKKQVSDAVDALIDKAPDTMDTFREISEWINNETDGAASMAKQIAQNTADISTNAKAISDEADARALADASIRTDFTNADTQLRKDFVAADASVLSDAKAYADSVATAAKNAVSAEGDAYVSASASNGKVTVAATAETKASLALADSALQKADIATGSANGTISVEGTDVAVKGLGSAAYTEASAYATAAQGSKADSAVQKVETGSANGTIKVDGAAVAVAGLKSAAFAETTAFDASGAAADASAKAYKSAQDYSDAKSVNGQTGHAITISGADVKVGGSGSHKETTVATSIEDLYVKVGEATAAGVTSFDVNANSANYASVNKTTGAVSFSVKTVNVADATAENNGLATSKDVKDYVDGQIEANKMVWTIA